MSNFKDDILEAANGEEIEAIVIGDMGWGDYNENGMVPKDKRGIVLTWDEAAPMLNYEYDPGYGAPECHCIEAFTASRVLSVSSYDGSTWVTWVNRQPTAYIPGMSGGG